MKYSSSNKPLYCPMTQSTWYKETYTQTPVGVLWHSTGANNPTVKRYVQPSDNASDRDYWLKIIGEIIMVMTGIIQIKMQELIFGLVN